MTVKIGDKGYPTTRPDNLDDQLIQSSGLNAAETARNLAGHPIASQVATALRPFLSKDAPSVPELASAIAEAGVGDVRDQVVKLYASAPAPAAAKGGASG